jgi:membrane dipeptidase
MPVPVSLPAVVPIALAFAALLAAGADAQSVAARARQVHSRAVVVDTHDDTTQRLLFDPSFDIGARHTDGSIDIPRLREGGLDALFLSVWTPGTLVGPKAVARALEQIEHVRKAVRTHADDLTLATSAGEIRGAAAAGRIAVLIGVEGGHLINDDLDVLRQFAGLGARYLTLTHSLNTNWADSSGDKPVHHGLTPFGTDVVRELNRLGMMVDLSHVSDETFSDALAVTTAPVIASHSSCRAITASPRNMTDDMLRAVARNGGAVMINYHSAFLSEAFRTAKPGPALAARLAEANTRCGENEACSIMETERISREAMTTGELPRVTWEQIVEHLVHAVQVAGIDHVGLGSDFDGATMPIGMEDVSKLPKITEALIARGYSDADVEKVLGGNLLRVMERVEAVAGQPAAPGARGVTPGGH